MDKGQGQGPAMSGPRPSDFADPAAMSTPMSEAEKPKKLRKQSQPLDQNSWTRSLAKAAVAVGLAPETWIVAGGLDDTDAPVLLNTDPRLAEDFAAECKVFYSKANDGRAQRAAMLADGVVRSLPLPAAVLHSVPCRR